MKLFLDESFWDEIILASWMKVYPTRENIGDENGRREGETETFTKAPGTGLVEETIPGAEKVDVRAPREWERGQHPNTSAKTQQSGRPRRGPKTTAAALVGPTPKEKRQRTPQACGHLQVRLRSG